MKFSRYFQQHQVPGWEGSYMNYTYFKQLYRYICIGTSLHDFETLNKSLTAEHERIESYYFNRLATAQNSVAALRAWYGMNDAYSIDIDIQKINREEVRDLARKSLALLGQFDELFKYGYLNRHAFRRIFRKLEHYYAHSKENFEASNLVDAHFFRQVEALKEIDALRNFAFILWPICVSDPPCDATFSLHLRSHETLDIKESRIGKLSSIIIQNDASSLQDALRRHHSRSQGQDGKLQILLSDLLEFSLMCLSNKCVRALLPHIRSFAPNDPSGTGNFFHRLTRTIGLGSKASSNQLMHHGEPLPAFEGISQAIGLLSDIVSKFPEKVRPALGQKDCFGRSPVHYAALYGLAKLCSTYLKCLTNEQSVPSALLTSCLVSRDADGLTPLQLSVRSGHYETTQALTDFCRRISTVGDVTCLNEVVLGALNQAITRFPHHGDPQTAHHLLSTLEKDSINVPTTLYLAAQYGCHRLLQDIVAKSSDPGKFLNTPDTLEWRTPLMVASAEGYIQTVKTLTQLGADSSTCDRKGWTAKDHAAFRGHLEIAEWFEDREAHEQGRISQYPVDKSTTMHQKTTLHSPPTYQRPLPVAKDRTQILLSIGPANTRSSLEGVDISPLLFYHDGAPCDYSGFALQILPEAATGPIALVQLPLLEHNINDPWCYSAVDKDRVTFRFNLIRLDNENDVDGRTVASAVAVLKDLQRGFSVNHESLDRDYTVPLLRREDLKLVGKVTFSFLAVTPLPHPCKTPEGRAGFWKSVFRLGKIPCSLFSLQKLQGLHVQLTKDWVPVIFHDFLVMETGGDTLLHTLSLNQFLHLAISQDSRGDKASVAEARYASKNRDSPGNNPRLRSRSLGVYDDHRSGDMLERMKLTDEGMQKPLKGNVRGLAIQEMFPTFKDLFLQLPDDVAFNVELKYPMLWEAEDRSMELSAPEINIFVDIILSTVYQYGGNRSITFSSFSPDICILLAIKQQQYPILFINKAGSVPTGDIRAANLQQAIRFAKKWKLFGIVMLSKPFVLCPRLVSYAKSAGLMVGTYGDLNDHPRCAMIQAEAGMDALIVNKVKLISQTLASMRNSS
ncbi:glycerophosphocholine phosphodiesterase GDE1 [Physcia stellaris]|nr:glycerophosphocholine phosphodiesterase GDE1 [Physcia stellaris]